MLKNFLLITLRNLSKNKAYTLINVLGLALGLSAFVLISAYVHFEKSFDTNHRDASKIYRVETKFYKGQELKENWPTSTNGVAKAMKSNFAEIESFARIDWHDSERIIRYGNVKYREAHVCYADSNFFSFFSYPLLRGNPETVLRGVNAIVISESAAKKYFGTADPVGKFLEVSTLSTTLHCSVTGVFKDLPKNSTMQFECLLSWSSNNVFARDFWYQHESYTFVKIEPGTDIRALEGKFPAMAEHYKSGDALKDLTWAIELVPLEKVHLNSAKPNEIEAKGNRSAVNFLAIMAFVILLIAYLNYINLATTKSIDRAREIGIRKVSGAHTFQLFCQFLLESFILNVVAGLFALMLILSTQFWILPLFSDSSSFGLLFDLNLFVYTASVFVCGVVLAGVYPSLVLSQFKAISVLKGQFSFSKSGIFLRKGMVAFQFTISLLLIAGTFAVYRQLRFMQTQGSGASLDQTLVIKAPVRTEGYAQKMTSLKAQIKSFPGISQVTVSGAIPGREVGEMLANRRFGTDKTGERAYEMLKVDHDFVGTYQLRILKGRTFDRNQPSDSTALVLNEAAVSEFGFSSPEDAIGKKIWLETVKHPDEVIGVIKNYHQQSLQSNYTSLILFMDPSLNWIPTNYFSVKLQGSDMRTSVSRIEQAWNQFFPESSFDFFFLNDFYNKQYKQDIQFGQIFIVFSALAIFIACMGLFGLSSYSTSRRIKEIGVRKVLGASALRIVAMLSWETVRLILFCSLLALPLAVFLSLKWMNGYAFRVSLTWWQFAFPLLLLILISITTTIWITIKAALLNPARSLRTE